MVLIENFVDYEILDMYEGNKIERWNNIILKRPDPQIIWKSEKKYFGNIDARYIRSNSGGGEWEIYNRNIPSSWSINYKDLTFNLKLMGFKHTGLFPEQSYNWDLIVDKIKNSNREINVLNLFAYTGGASVAALSAGASVVHVDSSKGMVEWAKENVKSSNLEDKPIRYIVDDVVKFVDREIRRNNKYDIIIMDPPSFGRGSNKEVWDIEKELFDLVKKCSEILSEEPILFLINSYTTGLSLTVLQNILELTVNKKYEGKITSDELGIKCNSNNLILPCGIFSRWERK